MDAGLFSRLSKKVSMASGHPLTFVIAVLSIILWAVLGPFFKYSNTWQLIINTATTILTFLMVFLIQNTQNRESQATQIKLDELIRALKGAQNSLLCLDESSQEELEKIREKYRTLANQAKGIAKEKSSK
jgi:low affinity Fe/Cu permease